MRYFLYIFLINICFISLYVVPYVFIANKIIIVIIIIIIIIIICIIAAGTFRMSIMLRDECLSRLRIYPLVFDIRSVPETSVDFLYARSISY